mmetsp:Transcript_54019/g.98793  ORF Transcript_54019/g.98793 Transcript_54019/m.98793 type:complete len:94 (-) Transcript_54019:152-433(-)
MIPRLGAEFICKEHRPILKMSTMKKQSCTPVLTKALIQLLGAACISFLKIALTQLLGVGCTQRSHPRHTLAAFEFAVVDGFVVALFVLASVQF